MTSRVKTQRSICPIKLVRLSPAAAGEGGSSIFSPRGFPNRPLFRSSFTPAPSRTRTTTSTRTKRLGYKIYRMVNRNTHTISTKCQ